MQYDSVYPTSRRSGTSSSTRDIKISPDNVTVSFKSTTSSLNSYLNSKPSLYSINSGTSDMHTHRGIPFPCAIHGIPSHSNQHFPQRIQGYLVPSMIKTSDSHPVISPQLNERLLQLADRSRRLGVHRYSRSRHALVLNEPVISRRTPPPLSSTIANRFYTYIESSKAPTVSQTYRPYRE